MKVFVHPREGNTAEVESWNVCREEQEQVMVVRGSRAYIIIFGETPTLEIWNVDSVGDLGERLEEFDIPAIPEQLEFDFVKNL
jgi:hypothetical protein